jgi:CRP-like cAMP-binding protein
MTDFNIPDRGVLRIKGTRGWPTVHGEEPLTVPLSAADRAELARLAEVIDFRTTASQIFRQGEPAAFIYLLVEGLVRTVYTTATGERQILAFHWPGDLFGLAEDGLHVSTAETIVQSRVYRFPCTKLQPFLLANPRIEDGFLVKAIHDLRSAQRQLIVMGRMDVAHRLAMFLLDCSAHNRFFDATNGQLSVPTTHYDIADYLGTSAETVTRALGRLARLGLVERVRFRTLRLDRAGLRQFVGFDYSQTP